jgi:kynurenine formamidase
MITALFNGLLLLGCASPGINESKVIDLTYAFNERTIYWPTARQFDLTVVSKGINDQGRWYAANDYCAAEHGGTHMDAPIHFAEGRHTAEQIPLHQMIGPARVIDVRDKCAADPDYLLAPDDVEAHEARHGRIQPGDVVLVHTGFGKFYPDAKRYLGNDVRGKVEGLHFPGISAAAARLFVDRRVDMVGLDTASLDNGPSTDFIAHQILNAADIPGLENIANLQNLPPTGATLIALPMKIQAGSGAPCRIIALLP